MGRRKDEDEPTLQEAWELLGTRLPMTVEALDERHVRVTGEVRGRRLAVEIEGKGARSDGWRTLFKVNTLSSRNQREKWRTSITIGCTNPHGLLGTIRTAVDANHPSWNPRVFDTRNGRFVTSEPPALGERLVTPDVHDRLMSILGDVTIVVGPDSLHIEEHDTAIPGKGAQYVAGSFLHLPQPMSPPQPWPDRAISGPQWWMNLLCDMADRLDAA